MKRLDQAIHDLSHSFDALEHASAKLPFRSVGWDDENDKPDVEDEPWSVKEALAIEAVQEIVDRMWNDLRELRIAHEMATAKAA